jgi:hypothetical protein
LRGFVVGRSIGVDAIFRGITIAARLSAPRDLDFLHVQFFSVFVTIEAYSLAGTGHVGFYSALGLLGAGAYDVAVLPYAAAIARAANDMPTARALPMLVLPDPATPQTIITIGASG